MHDHSIQSRKITAKNTMPKLSIPTSFMILWFLVHYASCSNNETDLQALLAIKKAIDHDPFGALNSWNGTLHFCSWKGIFCSKRHQNRVVSIDLMSQGLVGSLSPHLGNLSFLRSIVLQNNSFRGQIPKEIGRLRRLGKIEFSNNSFGGEIPRNLSQCRNLHYLNLIDNDLTGVIIPEISSLVKLEALGLTENMLTGTIPSFIGNLTSLVRLSLGDCGFLGDIPDSFVRLQRLELLNLSGNRLSGGIPFGLYNIPSIRVFSMSYNRLEGTIPAGIGFLLPRLMVLDLGYNHFTGKLPVSLPNASFIEIIFLSVNKFTGKMTTDFEKLSYLRHFNVADNDLEGDLGFISSMKNCTRLESLTVSYNLLSGSLPESIANLSILSSLSVAGNQLCGTIPSSIGNLIGLSYLNLGYNDFEGPLPSSIGKLYNLQELSLSSNRLTNELPFSLGNLTLLIRLNLGGNDFSGNIPRSLSSCTKLLRLNLSQNNLSGSIPQEIMTLSSISIYFDLAYNFFSGSIPSEVGSLRNLMNLDLSHNKLSGLIPNSLSSCVMLQRLHLEGNFLHGEIPQSLSALRGLQDFDLSENNLSGSIPAFLSELRLLNLNLSFNMLQGEVPTRGVFLNRSAVSVEGNSDLCGGNEYLKLPPCSSKHSKTKHFSTIWKILVPAVGSGAICFILSAYFCIIMYRRRISQKERFSMPSFGPEFLRLSYADLLKATSGFLEANVLGEGRFGSVYKGILNNGQMIVAVKVLKLNIRGASRSFFAECNALRGIRHRNLVQILSMCFSIDFQGNDFKALVYEFMHNGSLDKWLHQSSNEESRSLSLLQRLNIAIDIASALEYLHCGTGSSIVHGDLKPSNILLDENMTAHLGDFGLAKVISSVSSTHESSSIAVKGTIGYIPPEYGLSDMVSTQGDVYSYGILLLEIFTNTRPTDDSLSSHSSLHDFVSKALPSQVMEIVDPFILPNQDNGIKNCIISVLEIGVACSKELPGDRMTMTDVVAELHKIKEACMVQQ